MRLHRGEINQPLLQRENLRLVEGGLGRLASGSRIGLALHAIQKREESPLRVRDPLLALAMLPNPLAVVPQGLQRLDRSGQVDLVQVAPKSFGL
ncbi:hypothetical protein FQZ97_1271820 [compost metagenome]